ncbi:phage gp6-like head-tail connector protein (plasmid) [Sarcina sp. JB2]|uniref:Phage gp6-like head-tail connector protein n=1 Tax=Candidatus Sarcina troglodytae TaxID=2726954 RepID=A0ACD1BGI9_9CLOT|nr:head-tail connector protein [Sarcina sp. JB2]QPJ86681.1 phage gp6-like head-tail connector protein [Sarcina sp. JB2]
MDLSTVKDFLKVDFEDDDSYILFLIDVAKEYITDSLGFYDNTRQKQKYLLLTLIQDMYNNRSYTVKEDEKTRLIIRSIVLQEQLN